LRTSGGRTGKRDNKSFRREGNKAIAENREKKRPHLWGFCHYPHRGSMKDITVA
jgi:hypothetical protein